MPRILQYCKECGQPIGYSGRAPVWKIGEKVEIRHKSVAEKVNKQAGIDWHPRMTELCFRKGIVTDVTAKYVEVEFTRSKSPAMKGEKMLTGKFKFAPSALSEPTTPTDKMQKARETESRRYKNQKAWHMTREIAILDRKRNWYCNPFKSQKFAELLGLWYKKIDPRDAKKILGIRSLQTLWRQIQPLGLNDVANRYLVDHLCTVYDTEWGRLDKERKDACLVELMVVLLRENSLKLDAMALRLIEKRDFVALQDRVKHKHIFEKYGVFTQVIEETIEDI